MIEAKTKYGNLLVFRRQEFANGFKQTIETLAYEHGVVERIEKGGYNVFIDVGASFGFYSMIASKYAREVVAFEAHPLISGFTKWNMREKENVDVYNTMVGTLENEAYVPNSMHGMVGINRGHRNLHLSKMNKITLADVINQYKETDKLILREMMRMF